MKTADCSRCGNPTATNRNNDGYPQFFCEACWALVRDSWPACLRCGVALATDAALAEHHAAHDRDPRTGEFHYSKLNSPTSAR